MNTHTTHTPATIRLYPHTTDGGAEYLCDSFIECKSGHREGVFQGASFIVRMDGEPQLMIKNPVYFTAPELLAALEACFDSGQLTPLTPNVLSQARAALSKARGEA